MKYSTPNEADRAIKALSNHYTFPGVRTALRMMDDLKPFLPDGNFINLSTSLRF